MKKIFIIFLTASVISMLAGCGESNPKTLRHNQSSLKGKM